MSGARTEELTSSPQGGALREACERLGARPWAGYALFVLLAIAVYAPALRNGFVFDDDSTFRNNPIVRDPSRIWDLTAGFTGRWTYRPIRYLSFIIDHAIGGDQPWVYHLFNALYHGVVCCLVWRLLLHLARDGRAALAGALLFCLHPAHTECVAYVSGRRDLLTTLFYLAGMISFLRWRAAPGRGLGWLAASAASFVLALGSKEMAVTLPAMVVLYELCFDRPALRRHLPLYGLGFVLAALFAARTLAGKVTGQTGPWGGSWDVHALTALTLVGNYIRLTVFPATLLADYSVDAFPLVRTPLDPRLLVSLALLLACAAVVRATWARSRMLAFGVGWFFLTLAPVSQVIPFHELGADHYVYLPSVGACLAAGIALARIADGGRARLALGALGAVLLAFLVRTELRIPDWRSGESLYEATLATAPRCARARLNLGVMYANRLPTTREENFANLERALACADEAIAIVPDYELAFVGRATILARLGRREESERDLQRALELARTLRPPPMSSDAVLAKLGRWREAAADIEARIARRRAEPEDLVRAARYWEKAGDDAAALRAYERAAGLRVASTDGIVGALLVARRMGDAEKTAHWWKRAQEVLAPEQLVALQKRLQQTARDRSRGRIEARPVGPTGTAGPARVPEGRVPGGGREAGPEPRTPAPGAPGAAEPAAPFAPVAPDAPDAPAAGDDGR